MLLARVIVLALISLPTPSLGADEPTAGSPFKRGLWPFYTGDARPWAGTQDARALGPVFHWRNREDSKFFEMRPFYSSDETADHSIWRVLFPVVGHRDREDHDQTWLLMLGRDRTNITKSRRDTVLGPLWLGRNADGSRFGGLFPLAGKFVDRLGFDEITFGLWPLIARAKHGEYTETQILWPFFAWGSGGGRFKLRIWPFFGVERKKGIFDHRYFVWPLIHWRRDALDAETPERALYILPVYGRRDAGRYATRFYLWPLFTRQWDREGLGPERIDLLWPFYTRIQGPNIEMRAIRPVYSRKFTPNEREIGLLFGALARRQAKYEDLAVDQWRVFWAGRIGVRSSPDQTLEHFDLWPLYRYQERVDKKGIRSGFVRVPYILPMRGLDPDGWDRHYNKLFEVYGSAWRADEYRNSWFWGFKETRRSTQERWSNWLGFLPVGD